ncbi:leucine Rich repeat-containing domain protein [Cooperia oncophora]
MLHNGPIIFLHFQNFLLFGYENVVSMCADMPFVECSTHYGSNWQRVDLFTFQKDVKAATVENLARRCGGFLKKLSLKGCENIQASFIINLELYILIVTKDRLRIDTYVFRTQMFHCRIRHYGLSQLNVPTSNISVCINVNELTDATCENLGRHCHKLVHLNLENCTAITDRALRTCENLGRHCHKLVHLNLENCTAITDRALRYISDGCSNLQYLNISWCDNIQDKGVQMILAGCKGLTTLIMKGCEGLTEQVFANSIDNMKNLEVINLLSCFVNDETVAHIARGSPHLQYLCLSNCTQITDRSLISLSQGCRMLTDIELSGCSLLSDAGFIQLARHCKNLARMDLEDCSLITDATIHSLSTNCSNLSELSLSHCELITDESIHCLCTNNKEKLQVLELDNCPQITDSALSHMRHAKALKRIDLYDCQNVSKEAIQRFKHHRPHVEIHAYFAPATPPANPATARAGTSAFRVLFPISC